MENLLKYKVLVKYKKQIEIFYTVQTFKLPQFSLLKPGGTTNLATLLNHGLSISGVL